MSERSTQCAPMETHFALSQVLAREARLLDEYRYSEWIKLLAPEIHYHMPARRSHYDRDHRPENFHKFDTDHYDDDHQSLTLRTMRLAHPGGPSSNDPRPRETRAVSNIEVFHGPAPGVFRVCSVILLVRNRQLDLDESIAGRRDDEWRGNQTDGFLLTRRTVLISQNSVLMSNLASLL